MSSTYTNQELRKEVLNLASELEGADLKFYVNAVAGGFWESVNETKERAFVVTLRKTALQLLCPADQLWDVLDELASDGGLR